MALEKITKVSGTAVCVLGDDIDTDRIIPARYMKCVTFDGLGEFLFYDVRFDAEGKSRKHVLDSKEGKDASILISGNNFGCGSSREHAPQAIQKFGLRAVIALGFAEIFYGNCTTLGIPCVIVSKPDHKKLVDAVTANPKTEVVLDLLNRKVTFGEQEVSCGVLKEGALQALTEGQWDPIGQLLEAKEQVSQLAAQLPYLKG